ncbi:MAG: hypothetical protein IJZ68_07965 [Bacteroidaceae bacterium]|nr:hypothetical protein [Bacteroidaceae bacterium]
MKIRTDFVTNSSSSSFVTVRLYSEHSMVQFQSPDIYWEEDAATKMLKKLTKCKTMAAIMKALKISTDDIQIYEGGDTIPFDELTKVRIAFGYIMYGQEISEAMSDGEIDENSVWDDEGRVLEGVAVVCNMKTQEITPDKIDADDGYGV